MACETYGMGPTQRERESLKVLSFLKELGEEVGKYSSCGRAETMNQDTAKLCELCQNTDISKQSLELQMWWRDHQKADEARIEEAMKAYYEARDKATAIAKLTLYERGLLGLI